MFYYLNGTVTVIEPMLAVLDCAGVGYACHTTARTISKLKTGDAAKLFTYCHIREDSFDIFGFFAQSELNMFKMLLSISGVGPKAALSILSASSPEDLAVAIVTNDEKALTVAPGIGKKIAQRIIHELKDKLGGDFSDFSDSGGYPNAQTSGGAGGTKTTDVAAALSVLGYTPGEINAALRTADMELPVEEIIKAVLKKSLK